MRQLCKKLKARKRKDIEAELPPSVFLYLREGASAGPRPSHEAPWASSKIKQFDGSEGEHQFCEQYKSELVQTIRYVTTMIGCGHNQSQHLLPESMHKTKADVQSDGTPKYTQSNISMRNSIPVNKWVPKMNPKDNQTRSLERIGQSVLCPGHLRSHRCRHGD